MRRATETRTKDFQRRSNTRHTRHTRRQLELNKAGRPRIKSIRDKRSSMENLAVVEKAFAFALNDLFMKSYVCGIIYGETRDKKLNNSYPDSSPYSATSFRPITRGVVDHHY